MRKLAILLVSLGVCFGCEGRSEVEKQIPVSIKKKGYIATLNFSAGAPENPISDGFFPQPVRHGYASLIETLVKLQMDEALQGVMVKVRSQTFPFAQAEELGELLRVLGEKKIPVVCHGHDMDNSTYWLLRRGCSELWVSAAGSVPTVGIGIELSYLKGALDKIGVKFDMLAMGRYKSGAESLTRTGPGEDSLRNLRSTLSDLREQWLTGLTQGQPNAQALAELVEDGPYSPQKALELGLIDRVGFEDQAVDSIKSLANTQAIEDAFGPGASAGQEAPIAELVRVLAGANDRRRHQPRIALLPALGSITMNAEGPFGSASGITAQAMTKTLRKLREDRSVRAIVMRMDSPGGSPLASDLIWREMMLTRQVKPVVVSIAGMSASGGYYIACGATKIVASKAAIVGSIGVFGGKIVLNEALDSVGVTHFPVAASPEEGADVRAHHMSPLTPWDDATRERVRESMRSIYDLFVARVSEGRTMEKPQVYATAEGEIFLAQSAVERGLVDEIGGLGHAIAVARELGGLSQATPVVVEGAQETLLESLFLSDEPEAQEIHAALARFEAARLASVARLTLGGAMDRLRPYQAALAPLFAEESVIAALPFSITVR